MSDTAARRHRQLDLRHTHPALYHSIMILSIGSILLAVNFWTSTPTFTPYGWDDNIIGAIFFVIGAVQIVFLNVWRDLRVIRLSLAVAVAWNAIWGGVNTQQFFNGKASLQLPILYLILAVVRIPLLAESPVNPMTEKE
jgi:hypothetical protein